MTKHNVKFNPYLLSDNALIEKFVFRKIDVKFITMVLDQNVGIVNQHVLIIGPSGSGKTTLALRVAAEVRTTGLNKLWYPLLVPEVRNEVLSVGEFWREALFHLSVQTVNKKWKKMYSKLKKETRNDWLEARSLGVLLDFADSVGKRILLVVEDLDKLLSGFTNENDAWKLRHTLINEKRIMLLGTATDRFYHFENYSKAMYYQFKMHVLKPLGDDEGNAL